MKYPRILAALNKTPWAVLPEYLDAIIDTLGAHLRGDLAAPTALDLPGADTLDAQAAELQAARERGLAIIPVAGIIGKRLSMMETACGGVDVDTVAAQLADAAADPQISTILLDISSPGGSVVGVPELADAIAEVGTRKETIAFTDTLATSAGYYLAAACNHIYCTPTSSVGSIGVKMVYLDKTEWYKKEGYTPVKITAGRLKAEGDLGTALSPEMHAHLQAQVDTLWDMFKSAVSAHRPDVSEDTMQGQAFLGIDAAGHGLVDGIEPSRSAFIHRLLNGLG